MNPDPYDVLGLDESADAEQVRTTYRARARAIHPDVNPDPEGSYRFAELAQAYQLLTDPDLRAALDAERAGTRRFLARRPFARPRPVRGDDGIATLVLDRDVARQGGVTTVRLVVEVGCEACAGAGSAEPGLVATCASCEGAGHRVHRQETLEGEVLTWRPCRACDAAGTSFVLPCPSCAGTSRRGIEQELTVTLPPGIVSGAVLHLVDPVGAAGDPPRRLVLEARVRARQPQLTEEPMARSAS